MESVSKMTGKEFAKGKTDLMTQVETYFAERGNSAENSVIGTVVFDRKTVGDDIGHGIGRNKAVSFRAVPEVIENGEIIDAQYNWKNRGYDTVVIAAPITIANDSYFMALVIRREPTAQSGHETRRQRHYVHEVMIEKISTDFKTGQAKTPGAGVNADSSVFNLLQNVIEVKNGTVTKNDILKRINPDEGRFSLKEDTDITYDSLISKPDMKVVRVSSENVRMRTRKEIINTARENAEKNGHKDNSGVITVLNEDTKNNIVIGAPAIRHGLVRDYESNGRVALHFGEYLREAIKINEIEPRAENSTGGYILLGYGQNEQGEKYPAYFVVQTLTTGEEKLIEFDSLYSYNGKKISEAVGGADQSFQALTSDSVDDSAQGSPGIQSRTSSTISISDLLGIVNEMYSDILPESVAEHYGNERKKTKLGENVRFSFPDEEAVTDYMNEHDTEFVDVPPVKDYAKNAASRKAKNIEELQAQVEQLKEDKKLTHGRILDKKSVREQVNAFVRTLMTRSESYTPEGKPRKVKASVVNAIVDNIARIYTAINDGDYAQASIMAYESARETVEGIDIVDDAMFETYKELRDYLRNTKIQISESDSHNIPDFAEFKRQQRGKIRIVKEDGIPVDVVY